MSGQLGVPLAWVLRLPLAGRARMMREICGAGLDLRFESAHIDGCVDDAFVPGEVERELFHRVVGLLVSLPAVLCELAVLGVALLYLQNTKRGQSPFRL